MTGPVRGEPVELAALERLAGELESAGAGSGRDVDWAGARAALGALATTLLGSGSPARELLAEELAVWAERLAAPGAGVAGPAVRRRLLAGVRCLAAALRAAAGEDASARIVAAVDDLRASRAAALLSAGRGAGDGRSSGPAGVDVDAALARHLRSHFQHALAGWLRARTDARAGATLRAVLAAAAEGGADPWPAARALVEVLVRESPRREVTAARLRLLRDIDAALARRVRGQPDPVADAALAGAAGFHAAFAPEPGTGEAAGAGGSAPTARTPLAAGPGVASRLLEEAAALVAAHGPVAAAALRVALAGDALAWLGRHAERARLQLLSGTEPGSLAAGWGGGNPALGADLRALARDLAPGSAPARSDAGPPTGPGGFAPDLGARLARASEVLERLERPAPGGPGARPAGAGPALGPAGPDRPAGAPIPGVAPRTAGPDPRDQGALASLARSLGASRDRAERDVERFRGGMEELDRTLRALRAELRRLRGAAGAEAPDAAREAGLAALRQRIERLSEGFARLDGIRGEMELSASGARAELRRQARVASTLEADLLERDTSTVEPLWDEVRGRVMASTSGASVVLALAGADARVPSRDRGRLAAGLEALLLGLIAAARRERPVLALEVRFRGAAGGAPALDLEVRWRGGVVSRAAARAAAGRLLRGGGAWLPRGPESLRVRWPGVPAVMCVLPVGAGSGVGYVLPAETVAGAVPAPPGPHGRAALEHAGEIWPLAALPGETTAVPAGSPCLLLRVGKRRAALVVLSVGEPVSLVVEPLPAPLLGCAAVTGAALAGDADVLPLIDVRSLLEGEETRDGAVPGDPVPAGAGDVPAP